MTTKFTFAGCSLTAGQGLNSNQERYSNLVAEHFDAELNNIAVIGNTNERIFLSALNAILFDEQDKIFVQWSSTIRQQFEPEPNSKVGIFPNEESKELHFGSLYCSKSDMKKFTEVYFKLYGDYHQLLKLINYCNILAEVAKDKCDIMFINGLVLWQDDIARPEIVKDLARDLDPYTKELVLLDHYPDSEVWTYFFRLCKEFKTLDRTLWFNIFRGLSFMQRDVANDNNHPGPKSQQLYATKLIDFIKEYK